MAALAQSATVEREFQRVLHDRLLLTMFQPIVSVGSGEGRWVRGPSARPGRIRPRVADGAN
jgi:hypothetical protein